MENIPHQHEVLASNLTPTDHAELEQALVFADEHRGMIAGLSPEMQQTVIDLGTAYLLENNFTCLKKLFKNAVPYVAQGRIVRVEKGFWVKGNTNNHHITIAEDERMVCDCDLFHGRGKFSGQGGDCSHLQAAVLLELAENDIRYKS